MAAPGSYADRVKQRCDFFAIASRYTRLRRAGRQYVALCPFHCERHPSFYVEPNRKVFYCFGCDVGGDVFDFIMRAERCDFSRALELVEKFWNGGSERGQRFLLAERAGGEAPSARRSRAASYSQKGSRASRSGWRGPLPEGCDLGRACEPETLVPPIYTSANNFQEGHRGRR